MPSVSVLREKGPPPAPFPPLLGLWGGVVPRRGSMSHTFSGFRVRVREFGLVWEGESDSVGPNSVPTTNTWRRSGKGSRKGERGAKPKIR